MAARTPSVKDLTSHCQLDEKDLHQCIDEDDFNVIAPFLSEWKKVALNFKMSKEIEDIESNNRKEDTRKISFLKELKQKYSIHLTYELLVSTLLKLERAEDARCICHALAGKLIAFFVVV